MLGGGWEWQRDRLQPSAAGPTLPRVALSSLSLPQTPGVSPHMQAGVRVTRGATKEQEAAAAEPQEPFYCTAEQGRDTEACPKAQPDPASSGNRTLGAGGSPTMSLPLLPQALQQGLEQSWVPDIAKLGGGADGGQVQRQRTVPSSAGHFCSPQHAPAST